MACRRIVNPFSMVKCSDESMVHQSPRPCRPDFLPSTKASHKRWEPQVVFEDYDLMVITKPPGWHCTNLDHAPSALQEAAIDLETAVRKERVELLLAQHGSAPLHDYIIYRCLAQRDVGRRPGFGSDPLLAGVLNKDMLWGMIHRLDQGTSGCLLVAKNVEAMAWRVVVIGVMAKPPPAAGMQ
eukprot:Skav236850  [mRNA]  locus=scaffold1027:350017:353713:+ [translate_table: standard]